MRRRTGFLGSVATGLGAMALAACSQGQTAVAIDNDDIGGVVTNPNGQPEAGVWVVAETHDLDVRYIKIVVTDDEGRYVLPDLPQANYSVWARGYGLVDSDKSTSAPGQIVNIAAKPAPDAAAAAHYYPAIYWYSMLEIPPPDMFGKEGGELPPFVTRERYIAGMKTNGCIGCHQLGQLSTRTAPEAFKEFTGADLWVRRVQAGQAGQQMINQLAGAMNGVPLKYYGEWTDKIAAGALPTETPPRPQGAERNLVITIRDWMSEKKYLHDAIASDKRYPTVNAYGPLVGSPELSSDELPIMDPVNNTATTFHATSMEGAEPEEGGPLLPSAYWGDEQLWDAKVVNHNAMFGRDGRLWLTAQFKAPENSAFCKAGSDHPSAKVFPLERAGRRITILDLKTKEYKYVDTCFSNHHLQFGFDENETLWTSGGGQVLGWINTKKFDETGDAAASQGWTPFVLDTNGNGKRDEYVEPNQPVDPTKDKRIQGGFYAVMPNPADGSIWGTVGVFGGTPGIVRVVPGDDPSHTAIAEVYNLPKEGLGTRGGDIDSKGVVWISATSGHIASFDRSLCKGPLNGPTATGDHCPEGWKFYKYPGPGFAGVGDNSAESSYYSWVDQHNILGLGNDVPMSTANLNDGIAALVNGQMVMLRIPYPLGWYSKGFDGRIDDPNAGWKGRGLWMANGDRTPWLIEGGKGTKPLLAHIQLRPDPLAK